MFEKIKSYFAGIMLVWRHGGVITNLVSQWMRYPGLENSESLRSWIRPVLNDLATLTSVTETPVDDMIAAAALRIVENDKAWSAIYNLTLLVHYGGDLPCRPIKLPLECGNSFALLTGIIERNIVERTTEGEANCDETASFPSCPALVHAAIGLLLYLLQQRFGRGAL